MTGRPVIGLLVALVVEARHWTRVRWDFHDDACGRAWQFTAIAIALATALIWLDGSRYTVLPGLLSWLPLLLLPMQFVQSYGMRDSLPLGIFSFLARQRRERNERLGLPEEMPMFNFGNVLFAVVMVAASVGSRANTWVFLPGMIVLTGWLLLGAGHSRPLALIPVLVLSGFMALAGQIGLSRAEDWIGQAAASYTAKFNPNFKSTMLGRKGTVVQSPEIHWRLHPAPGTAPPRLMRTASFNYLNGTDWQNQRLTSTDFKDLDSRLLGDTPYYLLQPVEKAGGIPALPSFTLRGAASAESPLPLPGNAAGLRDFDLDGIDCGSFGTVRVFPKHSVIDGTVFWRGGTNPEVPPIPAEDLRVPLAEQGVSAADDEESALTHRKRGGVIHQMVEDLRLADEPTLQGKLNRLRTWFHREFRYTRELTIEGSRTGMRRNGAREPTVITRFLTETRAGHCEYFATAAVLMLRDAGIPARYAIGYAVAEADSKRGGYVLRGTHGHAWVRVWDEQHGQWIDFDPTPPTWLPAAAPGGSFVQRFNDGLKRLREDFFIWRNRPNNRLAVSAAMIGVGIALGAFVMRRLWRSKRRIGPQRVRTAYEGPRIRTPLHELESLAVRHLGARPPSQPFGKWFARLGSLLGETRVLDEAIALHQRLRFDPAPAAPGQQERLAELSRELEARLKHPGPDARGGNA